MATPVLTLIGRGPLRSLLLGLSSLRLLRSLLLGCSDLRLLGSLLLARSHHLLLLLIDYETCSFFDWLVQLRVIHDLKQGLMSLLGGRTTMQTKTMIKYIK
jgi:hypothetical protein